MKKISIALSACLPVYLSACLLVSLLAFLSTSAGAQVKTKFGDDVGTLNGIMKAYYDVVTVKKGEKISYERDSLMHWPHVLVGLAGLDKSGKPVMRYISLKEYHRLADATLEKDGFYEKEISRKVEKFGNVYHVWSTYESRDTADGPVNNRGINSIQLFFDGTRFWVMGWIFDQERKDNPLPSEYLVK